MNIIAVETNIEYITVVETNFVETNIEYITVVETNFVETNIEYIYIAASVEMNIREYIVFCYVVIYTSLRKRLIIINIT